MKIDRNRLESKRSSPRSLLLAALLALLPGCSDHASLRCGASERPMLLAQLFLGRNIGSRASVTDAQLDAFMDRVVTPRFPAGLTRVDAMGQWQGESGGSPGKESAEVVTLVIPDTREIRNDLEAIRQAYIAAYHQESVLLTHLPVCAHV